MLDFLKYLDSKPLYYDKIDLSRMPKAYELIKEKLHLNEKKIIHIVGTNAKGTTGRFLATALKNSNFSVGHYTSPHILKFNERIWLNNRLATDVELQTAHEKLYLYLGQHIADSLSYFEYTTFLATIIFEKCDYIVLEAGLGGEFDATNVFEKELSLFTPIDFDHESFLGNNITQIATTKMNSMTKNAILGYQKHKEVEELFQIIADEKSTNIYFLKALLFEQKDILKGISKRLNLPNYMKDNLSLALAALQFFGINITINTFDNSKLFGRLTELNSNVTIDVGHNLLAAEAICKHFKNEKIVLIYNSFKDKEYKAILESLKEIVLRVELIHIEDDRAVDITILENTLETLSMEYRNFSKIDKSNKYLVFGSFSVVSAFLNSIKADGFKYENR